MSPQTHPGRGGGAPGSPPGAVALELLAWTALAAALVRLLSDPARTNWDCASLLMQVLVWDEGRVPVSALAGMNPPLVLYFCAVPVVLSRLLGLPLLVLHTALVAAVVAVSAAALRALLRADGPFPPVARALALLGFAVAQLLATGEAFPFGQRDHLFATVAIPYLVLRAARLEGSRPVAPLALLVGLLAAFGVLLKPHFAVAVGAAEGGLALVHRRWPTLRHPEVAAAVAAAAAYLGHFALLPASYLEALGKAVRETLAGYGAFDAPLAAMVAHPVFLPALLAALAALLALGRGPTPERRLAAVISAFVLGGLAAFLLQGKGFGHHLAPALTGAALLAGALVREAAPLAGGSAGERLSGAFAVAGRAARSAALALLAASLAVVGLAGARLAGKGVPRPARGPLYPLLLERTAPREEVLFLSTTVPLVYPALLETDRRPLGRFLGPLMDVAYFQPRRGPGVAPAYRAPAEMGEAERSLLAELAAAIDERRPRLVLVSVSRNLGCPDGFSFRPYLEAAGFFAGPLAPYRHAGDVEDRWGRVEVWERAAPQPAAAPASPSRIDAATHSSIGGVRPG